MSEYRKYFLRQLGIKESQFNSTIDPDELEKGTGEERDEHGMPPDEAEKTARDHLGDPKQGHYYTGVDMAKKMGMLKEKTPRLQDLVSSTAKVPQILGISVRGSTTGGLPSGAMPTLGTPSALVQSDASDTATAPEGAGVDVKSKAALGGLEPAQKQVPNSVVVNKTPQNSTINSDTPIADTEDNTPAETHPLQVQNIKLSTVAQDLTGTTDNAADQMGEKPEPEAETEPENDITVDLSEDEKNVNLTEGKHKAGCQCGFCKNKGSFGKKKEEDTDEEKKDKELDETFAHNKKLMREKLGLKETKAEECKTCGCDKPNTIHDKKTHKLTENKLKTLREHFINKSKRIALTEREIKLLKSIDKLNKSK